MPERRKPFLLVGSSLAAVFVAGMMALTITMVVNVQPTGGSGLGRTWRCLRALRRRLPRLQGAPPAAPLPPPKTVPAPVRRHQPPAASPWHS